MIPTAYQRYEARVIGQTLDGASIVDVTERVLQVWWTYSYPDWELQRNANPNDGIFEGEWRDVETVAGTQEQLRSAGQMKTNSQ